MSDLEDRPAVVIDPAMCSGEPCIAGRRLPVYLVAETVWWHGVDEGIACFDVTREQLLVACWYAAVLPVLIWGRGGVLKAQPNPWPKRWRDWADASHQALWSGKYDEVEDPPLKGSP